MEELCVLEGVVWSISWREWSERYVKWREWSEGWREWYEELFGVGGVMWGVWGSGSGVGWREWCRIEGVVWDGGSGVGWREWCGMEGVVWGSGSGVASPTKVFGGFECVRWSVRWKEWCRVEEVESGGGGESGVG